MNEIETMQLMDNQFIVSYFDSYIDDDDSEPKINIVIEYCPNGDLSTLLEKQAKGLVTLNSNVRYLNENLVWKIFINLCLGLEHMHSRNYIHRDLKTLNIFMAKDNVAKIGDFG